MTFDAKTIGWLDQNRHRSYPMQRDVWRSKPVSPESGLDGVLLDATLFDADSHGSCELTLESVTVGPSSTSVVMKYAGNPFSLVLSGGSISGENSFETVRGSVRGSGSVGASVSFVFSSHAYLHDTIGEGSWLFGCPVLKSRVLTMTDGIGVNKIITNGSSGVAGNTSASESSGEIVIEDGYRTSPIAYSGKVFVRVGKRYGYDPCKYDFGDSGSRDCRNPLFFFCGQNAVNNGNVILSGGRGIAVRQGGTYTIDDSKSKCNGKTIPCIEIVAGNELLDICKPS